MDRSLSDSYVADAYDELLSQSEIQGHLNKVNLLAALEAVTVAVISGDSTNVISALKASPLGLKAMIKKGNFSNCIHSKIILKFVTIYYFLDFVTSYLSELQHALDGAEQGFLKLKEVESIVRQVNKVLLFGLLSFYLYYMYCS